MEGEVRVPLAFPGGQPHVRVVHSQGGSRKMMFDTGASLTVLSQREALRHGALWVDPRDVPEISARGVLGTESFQPAMLPGLQIGAWNAGPVQILVPPANAQTGLRGGLAILGFGTVARSCSYVTVDYPARELVLGFGKSYQPSNRTNVRRSEFFVESGVPMTRLRSGRVSWDAILDTGSFNGIEISASVARAMGREHEGIVVRGMSVAGVGGTKTSEEMGLRHIVLPELRAMGMTHRKAQVDIAPGPPRVGSFFFQDYKVTFDVRREKLWLEW